ncbi:hypothetical protein ANN_04545 [Periplaneta americana]|uniref:Uncharacterized protein n=1 Tax=Periplaneta americana TaxID=6978 RepID=A0ABQ8T8U0_PERAM|nr:hypothetical protein ANN_04545 [Periplaneta americana]
MNTKSKRMIETSEMKFLRYVAGYTLRDQVRNDVIRGAASCKGDLNNFKGKIVPEKEYRSRDLCLNVPVLYQLSYPGTPHDSVCGYKGKNWDGVGRSSWVAQLVERWYLQPEVPGSIPDSRTIFLLKLFKSALQEASPKKLDLHNIYVTVGTLTENHNFKSHRVVCTRCGPLASRRVDI